MLQEHRAYSDNNAITSRSLARTRRRRSRTDEGEAARAKPTRTRKAEAEAARLAQDTMFYPFHSPFDNRSSAFLDTSHPHPLYIREHTYNVTEHFTHALPLRRPHHRVWDRVACASAASCIPSPKHIAFHRINRHCLRNMFPKICPSPHCAPGPH